MPMNIPGGGVPETQEIRFKISPMWMSMDGLRDGSESLAAESLLGMPVMMGSATGKYMAVPVAMDMRMLNTAIGYSFTDDFFAALMLMTKENDMVMRFNSMMQGLSGESGFTMKSSGLADTMVMAKYRLYADDPLIPRRQASLLFALSMPTGSLDEKNGNHPLALRQTEQLPYSMQLGSGTFDPTVGILYQASRSPYWWGANASATLRLYDNDRDYHLGNEYKLDLYGMYQFRHDMLVQLQLNASHRDKIQGEMDEAVTGFSGRVTKNDPASPYLSPLWDPNRYGGRKVLATVGFQWQPTSLQILDFNVGVPLYQHLNGPQLEEDFRVMLTWYIEIPTASSIRYNDRLKRDSQLGF